MNIYTILAIIFFIVGLIITIVISKFTSKNPMPLSCICIVLTVICAMFSIIYENNKWECCNFTHTTNYCTVCGTEKPTFKWECCDKTLNANNNFCPDCGSEKPDDVENNN